MRAPLRLLPLLSLLLWAGCTTCPDGTVSCGGVCSIVASDPANCGACGNVCKPTPNTKAACNAGKCDSACNPDFADCDGNPANGCETSTTTNANNANSERSQVFSGISLNRCAQRGR